MRPLDKATARAVHPYAWLWEPLAGEPSFLLRPMFGARAVYLDGRIVLCFVHRQEPWRGLLVPTEPTQHAALIADFPVLKPHPVLPKWLYLPDDTDAFDRLAPQLVNLVRRRDPRIGVLPKPKKTRVRASARRPV